MSVKFSKQGNAILEKMKRKHVVSQNERERRGSGINKDR